MGPRITIELDVLEAIVHNALRDVEQYTYDYDGVSRTTGGGDYISVEDFRKIEVEIKQRVLEDGLLEGVK